MKIEVKLFNYFREGRFVKEHRDYADGTNVGFIIDELSIPVAELGVVMVNNRHVELDRLLVDGDSLGIFPKVGGG